MTIFGDQTAHAQSEVHSPMLSEAVLIAYVYVGVDILALIAITLFPLYVVIASSEGQTYVPAVETTMILALAQPSTSLDA